MFHRHRRRIKNPIKRGHVQPKDGHDQREYYSREQVDVLGCLVEQGRMLKDGKTTRTHRKKVEPLP